MQKRENTKKSEEKNATHFFKGFVIDSDIERYSILKNAKLFSVYLRFKVYELCVIIRKKRDYNDYRGFNPVVLYVR